VSAPTVSVIVPTYNRASLIEKTLESLLVQTHPPHEIIVVDDGSTDDTAQVVARFSPQVRYVLQENGGVSRARNHGASLASGEWLAFVDSDDVWHPDKLRLQIRAVELTGARWSITDLERIGADGAAVRGDQGFRSVFPVFMELGIKPADFFASQLKLHELPDDDAGIRVFEGDAFPLFLLGNIALPSSSLILRASFEACGGFDSELRIAEETEFFRRLSARELGVIVFHPLVGYRVNTGNSLVSAGNITGLIESALATAGRAKLHRAMETALERANSVQGIQLLHLRMSYDQLSRYHRVRGRQHARLAVRPLNWHSWRAVVFYAASYLPPIALRGLHKLKRRFFGRHEGAD